MNDNTLHVLNRFAGEKAHLVLLMTQDSEFYSLCQDYEACVKALQYWSASNAPEAGTRLDEYRTLVSELEDEISNALKSSQSGPLE